MPTVGTGKQAKEFPYTPAGIAAAKKEAKRTGQPLKMDQSKMAKGKMGPGMMKGKGRTGY